MLRGFLYLLLWAISGLVGISVLIWSARLMLTGNRTHGLSILVAGSLAGLLTVGLLTLLFMTFGEAAIDLSAGTCAAIFVVGFSWGSLSMAISLGLWPFVKGLLYQSRRWADRR